VFPSYLCELVSVDRIVNVHNNAFFSFNSGHHFNFILDIKLKTKSKIQGSYTFYSLNLIHT